MRIKLYGFILVLFHTPILLNVGLGPWFVPAIQVCFGSTGILWNGYEPFSLLRGYTDDPGFPFFMFGLTTANMVFVPDGVEAMMEADGVGLGKDSQDDGKGTS